MIRFLLAIALAGAAATASAQAVQKLPRIGVLYMGAPGAQSEGPMVGFEKGLRELGYVPGKNVVVEWRYAEGRPDRLPALAGELAGKVDVILAGGPGPLAAARQASSQVPIVTVAGSDPVAEGWAASLSRPAGNVTGLSVTFPELQLKRLELLKELLPGLARIAVLFAPRELPDDGAADMRSMEAAARRLGVQLQILPVREPIDIERVLRAAGDARAQAIYAVDTTFVIVNRPLIAERAARLGIPVCGEFAAFGVEGLLMAYGPDLNELLRRSASYVDRILKGARASELPIERPVKIDLILNLKVARALGVTVPQSLLLRAERVIE